MASLLWLAAESAHEATNGNANIYHSETLHAIVIPPEGKLWHFMSRAMQPHHHGFEMGLLCPRVSSEITIEVILYKYSRQVIAEAPAPQFRCVCRNYCFDAASALSHCVASNHNDCISTTHVFCWGPKTPSKIQEVTLMRPFHGNL